MPVQISILAAVLPISAYLFFIWHADRFERESVSDILKHFIWGALGAVFLSLLGGQVFNHLLELFIPKGNKLVFIESIYLAPVIEEFSKALFLFFTIRSKKIDNVTDGLIYGGSIGLGFGMVENFFYYVLSGSAPVEWIMLVLLRTFFAALMHAISTASVGAFAAKAVYAPLSKRLPICLAGLVLATAIHFIWNLSISFEFSYYLGILFMSILISLFITYFLRQRTIERKIIINELKEECDEGIIPYHYLPILSSKMKDRKGWIDEKIRNEYSNAAIKLAFRKSQSKLTVKDPEFFRKEALFYKNRLIELTSLDEN
jgi:RsiW-degrading membrane proteinase PrsW (M82 family)